jgi:SAM-dependent methyltransferase
MNGLDAQADYWDSVAGTKAFRHPLPLETLKGLLPATARILDYGCGYGRTVAGLVSGGFTRVTGVDVSPGMIARGRVLDSSLDLRLFDGGELPFGPGSFDCCLLMAVLTCIPTDGGQQRAVEDLRRVLAPGGILVVSDFPLQQDPRNRERYNRFAAEYGVYGVFRLPDGGVMRHHDMAWIEDLLAGFELVEHSAFSVVTMNGHKANAFRIIARKAGHGA